MNKTLDHIQKDITNDYVLADLLSELIKANIQSVADEVLIKYPYHKDGVDSIRLGAAEAWINRLCDMLRGADRDYLLQLLQNNLDKPSSRS
jgi:hypothetical protein